MRELKPVKMLTSSRHKNLLNDYELNDAFNAIKTHHDRGIVQLKLLAKSSQWLFIAFSMFEAKKQRGRRRLRKNCICMERGKKIHSQLNTIL